MENLKNENEGLKSLLMIVFAIGNFFLNALVVKTLWTWLVVPITGFKNISYVVAMAGIFFVDYVLYRDVDTTNANKNKFERLLNAFVYMLLSLVIGFVIHLFL